MPWIHYKLAGNNIQCTAYASNNFFPAFTQKTTPQGNITGCHCPMHSKLFQSLTGNWFDSCAGWLKTLNILRIV